ncbi:hypothetical protein [Psychrobium sp. 1_MG-2023]|uniref:hypothetical protein n=1 Tax=Psychrobium sp. 1_MG-2023 TaxID=3062624 RepID=UPI000C32B2E6|nr:hypothetical protein [Psychrobium sp. 1_MG-2023]MDP2562302.1 hypothetical protein [Psychrobium sp. 1_MG-2023]PKF54685.1 hypothetical protein CW748_15620 [Alteromonadales bacterium alter-6D02]
MTDLLVEYVLELNSNPEALAAHEANPEQAARDFGLDEADIQLILDQDVAEIQKRCDSSPIDTKGTMIMFFKP